MNLIKNNGTYIKLDEGEVVSLYSLCYIASDNKIYISTKNDNTKNSVVGIKCSKNVLQTSGILTNNAWSLTPGLLCYLGNTGSVIQDITTISSINNEAVVVVGKALSATSIDINIESPKVVLKEYNNFIKNNVTSSDLTSIVSSGETSMAWDNTTNIVSTGSLKLVYPAFGTNRYLDIPLNILNANDISTFNIKLSYLLSTVADDLVSVVLYDGVSERSTSAYALPYMLGSIQNVEAKANPSTVLTGQKLRFKFKDATAITFNLADVVINTDVVMTGSIISEWRSYTPTFQGFGTPTAIDFKFRQVGSNLEIKGKFTSDVTTALEARLGFPSGHTSRSDVPTLEMVGRGGRNTGASTTYFSGLSILSEPSVAYLTMGAESASSSPLSKSLASSIISNGNLVSFFASIPCAQFSSSMTIVGMNEPFYLANSESVVNTNGVVGKTIQDMGGTPIIANTAVTIYDMTLPMALMPDEIPCIEVKSQIDGEWVPIEIAVYPYLGVYQSLAVNTANNFFYGIGLNKAVTKQLRVVIGAYASLGISINNPTWANMLGTGVGYSHWRVRIGKNDSAWAIPPTVCAEMWLNANASAGTAVSTPFTNIAKDTHGGCSIGAGAKYTCRIAGRYNVGISSMATVASNPSLYKNGNLYKTLNYVEASKSMNASMELDLLVGDYIDLRPGSTITMEGNATYSASKTWMQITRIGS